MKQIKVDIDKNGNVKGLLTPVEAADRLGISHTAIYKHLDKLNCVKVGQFYFIPEKELEKLDIRPRGKYPRKKEKKKLFNPVKYIAKRNDQIILIEIETLRGCGCSYRQIADYFNVNGIGNTRGGYWSGQLLHDYEKRYEV